MPQVFTLHASLLNWKTFFASAITIITNQRIWRHSPRVCMCVCMCVLVCRRHIPELAWEKVRGSAQERAPEKQNSQRGLRRGRLKSRGPLLSPGPRWCLRGHMDACFCAPSHQLIHPPSPPFPSSAAWQDRPREWVMARVKSTPPHFCLGDSIVFSISCHLLFLSHSLLPPLSPSIQTICDAVLSILSLPFWGISNTVWKLGNRQLPLYYSVTPLPLSLQPLFLAGHRLSVLTIGLLGCSWPEVGPAHWGVLILSPWRSETNGVQSAGGILIATRCKGSSILINVVNNVAKFVLWKPFL